MKWVQISPPPINDALIDRNGKASVRFQNHLSELHRIITNLISGGEFTTTAGSATQTIAIDGAHAQDMAIVSVKQAGGTPRSIVSQAAGEGVITVVMSGDPGNDHILSWALLKLT